MSLFLSFGFLVRIAASLFLFFEILVHIAMSLFLSFEILLHIAFLKYSIYMLVSIVSKGKMKRSMKRVAKRN